jgi:hypothetical protein
MTIDEKLAKLADLMDSMAANDMGDLSIYGAALFHTACDAIKHLIEARATESES